MIGYWHATVFDFADPNSLATFYQQLLGMIRVQDDSGWITIGDAEDRPALAFQQVEGYRPPQWPGQEVPQQAHLDVRVKDLERQSGRFLRLVQRRSSGALIHSVCIWTRPDIHFVSCSGDRTDGWAWLRQNLRGVALDKTIHDPALAFGLVINGVQ